MNKRSLSILLVLLTAAFALQAQAKIAHLDITRLYNSLPEFQAAKDSLNLESQKLQAQGETMINQYTTSRENYEKRAPNMSSSDRQQKESELANMEQQIMAFRDSSQTRLEERRKALLAPLQTKVSQVLEAFAKEKGYDYILDDTEDVVRYANPADDITDQVITRMTVKK